MAKPITPFVACDVFVLNSEEKVLLIRRSDNGMWALPGGFQDIGETPKECAVRECFEETGYRIKVTELLGVFSSIKYKYVNYPWKDNEFCHLFFRGQLIGGEPRTSEETTEVAWYSNHELPPLSDGHEIRIKFGFKKHQDSTTPTFFE